MLLECYTSIPGNGEVFIMCEQWMNVLLTDTPTILVECDTILAVVMVFVVKVQKLFTMCEQ